MKRDFDVLCLDKMATRHNAGTVTLSYNLILTIPSTPRCCFTMHDISRKVDSVHLDVAFSVGELFRQ